ncbi:ThrRS/AlaRS common domain-containing protein [Lophiostoma macrostomum CBS 122681]|uniref:ThrRS/AlaRS common domain-containing protein n=1 Tax=Lophiostoma macrostomum CBS 122681 TaxID=1314788 RepID=A0A6A6SIC5_9PLEO|nr:ThrRS/AlaRS common domain-containing protein [Lophiostoma macrostomum CBS 122681]
MRRAFIPFQPLLKIATTSINASGVHIPASVSATPCFSSKSGARMSTSTPSEKTEALYQKDGSLHKHTTTISSVTRFSQLPAETQSLFKAPPDAELFVLTMPQTIFHAQGGGQPSDTGSITKTGLDASSVIFQVHQVRKPAPDAPILHLGIFPSNAESSDSQTPLSFSQNHTIVQEIDQEKRFLHSRLHTAGHVIGAAINILAKTASSSAASGIPADVADGKASHYPGAAFVEFTGLIPGTAKAHIQELVDKLVQEDLAVRVDFWTEAEANAKCISGADGIAGDENGVRVVEIGDRGSYPCGGTHVKTLRELGRVVIRGVKRQKGVSKVSYEVADA